MTREYRRILIDEVEQWERDGWHAVTRDGSILITPICGGIQWVTAVWRTLRDDASPANRGIE